MLKTIFWTMAALTLTAVLWLAIPSEAFIRPLSWTYDSASGKATFRRLVQWPRPIRAAVQIEAYAGDLECQYSGTSLIEPGKEAVTRRVPADIRVCLDAPDSMVIMSLSVLVFGLVPLRPVTVWDPPNALARLSR